MTAIHGSALALALSVAAGCGGGDGEPAASAPPAPVSEVEPNDGCASANPLAFGATYVGTIASGSDLDVYAFDVPAENVSLEFLTFDRSGAGCSGVDIQLSVRTAECSTIFAVSGGGGCPPITMSAPPGRMYLDVRRRPQSTVATPFGYAVVTRTKPAP